MCSAAWFVRIKNEGTGGELSALAPFLLYECVKHGKRFLPSKEPNPTSRALSPAETAAIF